MVAARAGHGEEVVRQGRRRRAYRVDDQGGGDTGFGHEAVRRRPARPARAVASSRPTRGPGQRGRVTARTLASGLAAVTCLLATVVPATAQILKTRMQRPSAGARQLPLNVGSGFEYETDGEESEYGFPFLAEYGFTDQLKLSLEPAYVLIRKKAGGTIRGPGDFETTFTWELPT